MPDIATIRQTAERLREDGLPVSEYALRRWVRAGKIPAAKCGEKALLFYPNVITYIKGGESKAVQQDSCAIRRVEV